MPVIDARGKSCPMPIVLMSKAMNGLPSGERVIVKADDRAFPEDVTAWCKKTGNVLVGISQKAGYYEAEIRRA